MLEVIRDKDADFRSGRADFGARLGGSNLDVRTGLDPGSRLGPAGFSLWLPVPKVPVPRFAVGIVIGRNGEMIKKIQNDAGVRIQFKAGLAPVQHPR